MRVVVSEIKRQIHTHSLANWSNTMTPRLTTSESIKVRTVKFILPQNKPINKSCSIIFLTKYWLLETDLDLSLLLTTLRTCAGSPTRGMGHGAGATFFETSETREKRHSGRSYRCDVWCGCWDGTFGIFCDRQFNPRFYAGVVFIFLILFRTYDGKHPKKLDILRLDISKSSLMLHMWSPSLKM